MRTTAIIPVKRFGDAKQRLLEALDRPQRAAIVKAMLTDVLASVTATELVERVIVVTGEGRAERIALAQGRRTAVPLEVLRDPTDSGHSPAATLGIVRALSHRAQAVALLPGDCPLLDADELDAALERLGEGTVVVVPDRHETGTNGLLMAPADAIGPAFGEGSMERHRDRAARAGHTAVVERISSLALDLDTPDDLAALTEVLGERPDLAPTTAAELARPAPSGGGR